MLVVVVVFFLNQIADAILIFINLFIKSQFSQFYKKLSTSFSVLNATVFVFLCCGFE